jgi:salicylate hydroxylase
MSDAPHVLIAGAGVGGLASALALVRRGWRVTLLERMRLAEDIGAGLQISPNAGAILRELDVLRRLSASALAPSAIHIRRGRDGATIARLPLDIAERRWGAPYLLAHRGDLHKALVEAVAEQPLIRLVPECTLTGFAAREDGITADALHGGIRVTHIADCLIGADGMRSHVRRLLAENQKDDMPAKARHVAWRTVIKSDGVALELRQPESTLWLGAGAHVVHYPLRGGRITNVVAVLDETVPIDGEADIWAQPGDPRRIAARFATWDRRIRALIASADEWRIWPLVERAPPPAWSAGRVALIGDAAHPILPFLAQGAAQAIEDAASLANYLEPGAEISEGLAKFAAARRSRVIRVQNESRHQAWIYHLAPPAAALRDFAIRALGAERITARYDWIYGA